MAGRRVFANNCRFIFAKPFFQVPGIAQNHGRNLLFLQAAEVAQEQRLFQRCVQRVAGGYHGRSRRAYLLPVASAGFGLLGAEVAQPFAQIFDIQNGLPKTLLSG